MTQKNGFRSLIQRWFALGLCGLASAAQAQSSYTYTDIFTLQYPDNDLSIKMLQLMFGQVGTSLNVTSTPPPNNPVIGTLFMIFNSGVLTMCMLLVTYSVVYQAINVSQDGAQGMSKQSTAFLTFRIVMGSSLLLPAFSSGYSAIQVMVMNTVVYGVAFANYAWTQTYQIAMGEESGTGSETSELTSYDMLPQGLTNTWGNNASTINFGDYSRCQKPNNTFVTATDIFAMALCTQLYAKMATENGYTSTNYTTYYQDTSMTGTQMKCDSKAGYYLCFGNISNDSEMATLCGNISFQDATQQNAIMSAVSQAMGIAQNYAATAVSGEYIDQSSQALNSSGSAIFDCSGMSTMPSAVTWPSSYTGYQNVCSVQSNIAEIAQTYANALIAAYPSTSGSSSSSSSDDNYQSGWATAGQYFQTLSLNIASGTASSSASSSDASTDATTLLNYRGKLSDYNYQTSDSSSSSNSGNNNCQANAAYANTPACTTKCVCLDIEPTGSDSVNSNLTWFYDAVLPAVATSPTTYGYYSGASSSAVAQDAQSLMDESSDSGAPSDADQSINSVENEAACTIAAAVTSASTSIGADMPAYLQTSNVMSPGNLSGTSTASEYASAVGAQKIDFATTNMMLSVNMVIQSLTGMKIFPSTITSTDDYISYSNGNNICPNCSTILNNYAQNCTGNTAFLNNLFSAGYLTMGSSQSSANTSLAGLFGEVLIDQQGWTSFADPLANLTNLGVTMIAAGTYYYLATMQQLFQAILTISLAYTGYVAAAKLILAGANAMSSGMFEPVFVSIGALVEQMFMMLFALDKFALELFIPLGTAIAGILFTQGVVLGVFLPFLATIIYLFGVLGWLFAVIEGMVASALVAMGMTHPEGHDLLGHSEQALMLLLGVFIRPVAMVIGLFFAISVSQATMNLVNTGFLYVVSDYFNTTMQQGAAGTNVGSVYNTVCMVSTIGILLVYTYICYSILEMCYGLISQIPDRILRWIGGPQEQSQATAKASEIKGQVQGSAKSASDGAGASTRAPQVDAVKPGINVGGAGSQKKGAKIEKDTPDQGNTPNQGNTHSGGNPGGGGHAPGGE